MVFKKEFSSSLITSVTIFLASQFLGRKHPFDFLKQPPTHIRKALSYLKSVRIRNGSSQNSTNYVTSTTIRRQLTICNGKSNRTNMVYHNSNCNIFSFSKIPSYFCQKVLLLLQSAGENISVIIRFFTLQRHTKSLKSHSCINMFFLEVF